MTVTELLQLIADASTILAALAGIGAAVFISLQVAHMKRSREVDTFLRIMEAGNTPDMRHASQWVKAKVTPETTYEHTRQGETRDNIALVTNYFEMVGILVERKYVSADLVYDQMGSWIVGTWSKLNSVVASHRSAKQSPQYAENFELLVNGYDGWAAQNPPKLEKRNRPTSKLLASFYSAPQAKKKGHT